MALPLIILLLLIYGYTLLILLLRQEIERDTDPLEGPVEYGTGVSVVVPFRNEEEHLPGLLEDLTAQSYPRELLEILLVDDHSSDASGTLAAKAAEGMDHLRYLSVPVGKSGKKKALAHGIRQARHERIIQVDADCRLEPGFVAAHMAFLAQHPSHLVAGMVTTRREKGGLLEVFDRLDLLSLTGTGAGSFGLGRPMMCSGANLSYSKSLYLETRSFDPEDAIASGDDMFLMIGARKLGRKLSFISKQEAMVRTAPRKDLGGLIRQRVRWASKAGKLKMPDIQWLAVLVVLANLSILLMPLWFVLFQTWWPWLAAAWLAKTGADFMLLHRMTGICDCREDLLWFIPVSLLYYPYLVAILLGSIFSGPKWKQATR